MAKNSSQTNWTSVIASLVAIGSLILNVVQYFGTRSAQQRELYSATAFFAFANDHTILQLYGPATGNALDVNSPDVGVGSQVARTLQEYAMEASTSTQIALRSNPVASFLVVQNNGKRELRNLTAFSWDSASAKESPIVKKSVLLPNDLVLFPLDFRSPGNDANEPNVPDRVIVRYEGRTLEVTQGEKITWLNRGFVRAMISRR